MTPTPIAQRLADALRGCRCGYDHLPETVGACIDRGYCDCGLKSVLRDLQDLAQSGGEEGDSLLKRLSFDGHIVWEGDVSRGTAERFVEWLFKQKEIATQPLRAPDTAPKGDAVDMLAAVEAAKNAYSNYWIDVRLGKRSIYDATDSGAMCAALAAAFPALVAERDTLLAENARNAKDAERYRWLRESVGVTEWPPKTFPTAPWCVRCDLEYGMPTSKFVSGQALDAAIDAAKRGGE